MGGLGAAPIRSAAWAPDDSLMVAGPLAKRRPVIRNANRARSPAPRFMGNPLNLRLSTYNSELDQILNGSERTKAAKRMQFDLYACAHDSRSVSSAGIFF